ncbi:fibronectin type III domain-containing protein, partial [Flavivirga aquimarina]
DTTVDLSWLGATDNIGVTGYNIYIDGVLETTLGNVSSYQVTGLTAATSYDFRVTALDASSNESVVVSSNTVTVITDLASSGGGSGNWILNNQDVYYNVGNVGIGTDTPDEKLAVNGNIHTKEIRVDLSNWPDYVFTKDYNLPTLAQIEEHIQEKGHLPNIPSAKDVQANGVHLGEMNAKLLEKIEELILYTLQQQKELEAQKERIKVLESKN